MRAEVHGSIEEVPDSTWDFLTDAYFFFHRPFLEVMRDGKVENARYRYIELKDGDEIVGFAVLSRFFLHVDTLAEDKWVTRLQKIAPKLLEVPVVCCGVPASFGQHHLHVVDGADKREAVALVEAEMQRWAGEERTGMLAWKEWTPALGIRDFVKEHGYEVYPTLPDHQFLDLPEDENEWLGRMRRSYRGKYKPARKLMEGDGPVWEDGPYRLEEMKFEVEHAQAFYDGYIRLMDRVESRLETYPLEFFRELAASDLDTRRLFFTNNEYDEELTALLIARADFLSFILVAKDRAEYKSPMYPLMLRALALYAMRNGFHTVRLGQTSSYAKCQAGGIPLERETYLKMPGRLRHKALQRYGHALFPEPEIPEVHVFKEDEAEAKAAK